MIRIYTDLDSLWDTRRMILTKLAREAGKPFDWDRNFAAVYKQRKYDIFEYPDFGFSEEAYWKRFEARTSEDWVNEQEVFAQPSRLIYNLFKIVRELEFGVGKLLGVDRFELTINTFPYVLSEEQRRELDQVIAGTTSWDFDRQFVSIPHAELTPVYLGQYKYVFKYNLFVGRNETKAFWDRYYQTPPGQTSYIVPDVLAKKSELPDGMDKESAQSLVSKLNLCQAGFVTWIAVDKAYFDYIE